MAPYEEKSLSNQAVWGVCLPRTIITCPAVQKKKKTKKNDMYLSLSILLAASLEMGFLARVPQLTDDIYLAGKHGVHANG